MSVGEQPYTLRCSNETEKSNPGSARTLERVDGRGSASSSGQHRIEYEEIALSHITRNLEVVIDRLERVVIPVESDMSNARGRNETKNSFDHSESGSKDRDESQLFSAYVSSARCFQRSLDIERLDSQVDRCLVGHEHRDLVDKLLEDFCWSIPISQHSQLVLNERMPDNCQRWKFVCLFDHFSNVLHVKQRCKCA